MGISLPFVLFFFPFLVDWVIPISRACPIPCVPSCQAHYACTHCAHSWIKKQWAGRDTCTDQHLCQAAHRAALVLLYRFTGRYACFHPWDLPSLSMTCGTSFNITGTGGACRNGAPYFPKTTSQPKVSNLAGSHWRPSGQVFIKHWIQISTSSFGMGRVFLKLSSSRNSKAAEAIIIIHSPHN